MSLTASEIREMTMIALDQPPFWPETEEEYFKFTVGSDSRFEIILGEFFDYAYGVIDWGDGSSDVFEQDNAIRRRYNPAQHTYELGNNYQIIFTGILASWSSSNPLLYDDSIRKLISVDSSFPKSLNHSTSFAHLFHGAFNLVSIPGNLFARCSNAKNFEYAFTFCTSLTSIPSDIFSYCPLAENFHLTFYECALINIPSGLFDKCFNAKSFYECFWSSKVETIPIGLFDNCINATTFRGCFKETKIKSIPDHLFDNCELAYYFGECFQQCLSLEYVPFNLFEHNHPYNPQGNPTVGYCFAGDISIISDVPELWITHSDWSHYSCFSGCRNALNYSDIPQDWGGPT